MPGVFVFVCGHPPGVNRGQPEAGCRGAASIVGVGQVVGLRARVFGHRTLPLDEYGALRTLLGGGVVAEAAVVNHAEGDFPRLVVVLDNGHLHVVRAAVGPAAEHLVVLEVLGEVELVLFGLVLEVPVELLVARRQVEFAVGRNGRRAEHQLRDGVGVGDARRLPARRTEVEEVGVEGRAAICRVTAAQLVVLLHAHLDRNQILVHMGGRTVGRREGEVRTEGGHGGHVGLLAHRRGDTRPLTLELRPVGEGHLEAQIELLAVARAGDGERTAHPLADLRVVVGLVGLVVENPGAEGRDVERAALELLGREGQRCGVVALLELLGLCGIDLAEEQDVRDARGGENLRQRLLLGIARLGDADEVGALEALAEAAFIVGAQPSAALLGIEREGQFALGVDSNMEGSGRSLAAGEAAAADLYLRRVGRREVNLRGIDAVAQHHRQAVGPLGGLRQPGAGIEGVGGSPLGGSLPYDGAADGGGYLVELVLVLEHGQRRLVAGAVVAGAQRAAVGVLELNDELQRGRSLRVAHLERERLDGEHRVFVDRQTAVRELEVVGIGVNLPLGVGHRHTQVVARGLHLLHAGDARRGREVEGIVVVVVHLVDGRTYLDGGCSVELNLVVQRYGRRRGCTLVVVVRAGRETSCSQ